MVPGIKHSVIIVVIKKPSLQICYLVKGSFYSTKLSSNTKGIFLPKGHLMTLQCCCEY